MNFLVCYPVKDVNRGAFVDEDFFHCIIFYFNSDDHRVILLMIEAMKVIGGMRRL